MELYDNQEWLAANFEEAVNWRRALHRYPQPAWLEFYATGFIAEKLAAWGYTIFLGSDIISKEKQLLAPDKDKLQIEYERALKAGIKEEWLMPTKGGFTGVVATLAGTETGPVVGFRFDMDSNEVAEANEGAHHPFTEGFSSEIDGYAHMCGHDCHMAMGLLLAKYFSENRDKIKGTVKFIFQPNEENLSGAAAMVDKGVADDLDYLLAGHVGLNVKELGHIALNVHSFMAISRFEVSFSGRPSHSALRPDEGRNALLGACTAITNLYAIARHGLGASRVNVGTIQGGTTWNVIPDKVYFRMETRGVTNEINEYMVNKAREVITGAAKMYGLSWDIKPAATGFAGASDASLIKLGTKVAQSLASVNQVLPEVAFNASEDITLFMDRVQKRGGKALFSIFGTPTYGGHHNTNFDVDERVIQNGAEFLAGLYCELTS